MEKAQIHFPSRVDVIAEAKFNQLPIDFRGSVSSPTAQSWDSGFKQPFS
jgi:hypothetical protein